ncbi:MAG: NAD(+)/NADH kinase [Thermoplasmata archaeon]
MKIGITYNPQVIDYEKIIRYIVEFFGSKATIFLEDNRNGIFPEIEKLSIDQMDIDALISIGGDGTILRALMYTDAPIIGINAGDIGFLSEIPPTEVDIQKALSLFMERKYYLDERMKLDVFLNDQFISSATNEVVIHTTDVSKVRRYEISINDEKISRIRGDGIIVSTPTGSTCYSMSAGGPIVDPSLSAMVIVSINSFRTPTYPMVVNSNSLIKIIPLNVTKNSIIVIDGFITKEVDTNTIITIKESRKKARFYRFGYSFFKKVSEELLLYSVVL